MLLPGTRARPGEHTFNAVEYRSREDRNDGIVRQWMEGPPGDPPDPVGRYELGLETVGTREGREETWQGIAEVWPEAGLTRAEYDAAMKRFAQSALLQQWNREARHALDTQINNGEDLDGQLSAKLREVTGSMGPDGALRLHERPRPGRPVEEIPSADPGDSDQSPSPGW